MQIPIFCESLESWIILELQGAIEGREVTVLDGLALGKMIQRGGSETEVILTVGNSMLDGKKTALAKPIVVLRKIHHAATATTETMHDDSDDRIHDDARHSADESGKARGYQCVGVVREKYVFKTRPRTSLTAPPPEKKFKSLNKVEAEAEKEGETM
eukprot:ANDGO_04211.mRNA.1 hypothetical protein